MEMTKQDKEDLLRELKERAPYGVKAQAFEFDEHGDEVAADCKIIDVNENHLVVFERSDRKSMRGRFEWCDASWVKPYLRPMEAMTDDEKAQAEGLSKGKATRGKTDKKAAFYFKHHIDCNGLIERGLAVPAKEGVYKK